jgi:ATP-dependent Lon protease
MAAQSDSSLPLVDHPLLPIRNTVIFPGQTLPLIIGRPRSLQALDQARILKPDSPRLLIVTQKNLTVGDPSPDDLHPVGVLCELPSLLCTESAASATQQPITVRGIQRVRLNQIRILNQDTPQECLYATGAPLPAPEINDPVRAEALLLSVDSLLRELGSAGSGSMPPTSETLPRLQLRAARLYLQASTQLPLSLHQKQELLERNTLDGGLELLLGALRKEYQARRTQQELERRILQAKKAKSREFVEDELNPEDGSSPSGDSDDPPPEEGFESSEAGRLATSVQARLQEAGAPSPILKQVQEELNRLKALPPGSAEHAVLRNWFEWVGRLPWRADSIPPPELTQAGLTLAGAHSGIEEVKRRILEFVAVSRLRQTSQLGTVICLAGPPGVGKTTLARSIAQALGRSFARVTLGGVRDEAEIRGHRRTYVGAMPGKILQSLRRAGSRSALLLLDEIDKIRSDLHGDPSAALLEVLDPELNTEFLDHYINLPFDLSQLFFIATANDLSAIPHALRDRLEIIELPGYTESEKIQIAREHLIPRELEAAGFAPLPTQPQNGELDETLARLIDGYTHEAGVRDLQRRISSLFRAEALRHCLKEDTLGTPSPASNPSPRPAPDVDLSRLSEIMQTTLGPARRPAIRMLRASPSPPLGVAHGLAWSPLGGEVLRIEAALTPGKGQLHLTGNLGEVMRESIRVALSLALRLTPPSVHPDLTTFDLHLHAPSASTPKDGPSAGLPLLESLLSLFLKRALPEGLAASGEITLHGGVLPVGGLEQKIHAARREGFRRLILPEGNREAVLHLGNRVLSPELEVHWVSQATELLPLLWPEQAQPEPWIGTVHNLSWKEKSAS